MPTVQKAVCAADKSVWCTLRRERVARSGERELRAQDMLYMIYGGKASSTEVLILLASNWTRVQHKIISVQSTLV